MEIRGNEICAINEEGQYLSYELDIKKKVFKISKHPIAIEKCPYSRNKTDITKEI